MGMWNLIISLELLLINLRSAEKGHRNGTLELVKDAHGPVNGNFSCPDVSQYQCWVQMEDN